MDWIAERPWADGKVAMYSYSYGGIMQAWVAAERPEHLVALTPANIVGDTYRDIGFPGEPTRLETPISISPVSVSSRRP